MINVEVVYSRFIGGDDTLERLRAVLASRAPVWFDRLRLHRTARDYVEVDLSSPGSLGDAVVSAVGQRGALYRELVARHGAGHERLQGGVELRGATPGLIVVIYIDQEPFAPTGDKLLLQNAIALQLPRAKVEAKPARAWAVEVFRDLCEATSPVWGAVVSREEYWAKVMSDPPGAAALGRDFSRYLPGLFTMNFFGERYVALIGRDRLMSLEGPGVESVGDGVTVALGEDPKRWDSPERQQREQAALDHLGPEFFFSKDEPARETRAPSWGQAAA